MKAIVDAGGTKLNWCVIAPDGAVRRYDSPGVNVARASNDELHRAMAPLRQSLAGMDAIYFYGAGVTGVATMRRVAAELPAASVVAVSSDLLGAARGLLGHKPGVVAIMGTGSNSGFYDGRQLERTIPPMGYVIGDEGSGTALGKALLRGVYRGVVEPELRTLLEEFTGLDYAGVIDRVYRQADAPQFLAGLAPFIRRHYADFPRLQQLVDLEFQRFKVEVLALYHQPALAVTGGIADAFAPELHRLWGRDFAHLTITKSPMEGLIKYHSL